MNGGGARDISVVGSDVHDASTLMRAGHAANVLLEGTRLYGSTETVLGHNDAISSRGGLAGFTVRNSEVQGRVIFTDGESAEPAQNKVSGLSFSNVWFSNSPSAGVYFGALTKGGPGSDGRRGVFGTLTNVHIWNAHGVARMEQILQDDNKTLASHYDGTRNTEPDRVNVTESNVDYGPPPAGSANPAFAWRKSHPYDSFADYFAFAAPLAG